MLLLDFVSVGSTSNRSVVFSFPSVVFMASIAPRKELCDVGAKFKYVSVIIKPTVTMIIKDRLLDDLSCADLGPGAVISFDVGPFKRTMTSNFSLLWLDCRTWTWSKPWTQNCKDSDGSLHVRCLLNKSWQYLWVACADSSGQLSPGCNVFYSSPGTYCNTHCSLLREMCFIRASSRSKFLKTCQKC